MTTHIAVFAEKKPLLMLLGRAKPLEEQRLVEIFSRSHDSVIDRSSASSAVDDDNRFNLAQ